MKRKTLALALVLPLALVSCGGNLAPVAASLTPAVVSAETVVTLRTWCQRGAPLIDIARGQNLSSAAREIADVVAPYCAAMTAGQVPVTTDANTGAWLAQNLNGLSRLLGLALR